MFQSLYQVGSDPFVIVSSLLLIPITCCWLALASFTSATNRWLAVSAAGMYALFAGFFFPWSLFSVYVRWIGVVGWLIAAVLALRRPLAPPLTDVKTIQRRRRGLIAALSLILLLDASIVKGMIPWTKPFELAFPFKGGLFSATEGGGSFWINYHYGEEADFRYAVDIVKVGALGARAFGLLPSNFQAYRIYGETVYSPCSGTVVMVHDGVADSPLFTPSATQPGGNQIDIDCGGALIQLEHLLMGSIAVTKGQTVAAGDPLARVGSSGLSSEPHLHIQANAYSGGIIGDSLPMTFGGRYLIRNSLVLAPK